MDRHAWRDLGSRPLFFPALSVTLGALCAPATNLGAEPFLLCGALLGALGLALARLPVPGAHLAVLAALWMMGAGLAGCEARVEVPSGLTAGGPAVLEGEAEQVDRFDGTTRVRLAVALAGAPTNLLEPARFRVSLSLRGGPVALLPGQRLRVETKL
ncbi:DUF4131 domain-containing protein, partial [Pyxidicoccus sp. 3LG]